MKKLTPYLIPLSLLVIALSIFSLDYESKMGGEPMMGATTKIKLTDPNSVTPAATSTPTANMIPIASSTGRLEGEWYIVDAGKNASASSSYAYTTTFQNTGTKSLLVNYIYSFVGFNTNPACGISVYVSETSTPWVKAGWAKYEDANSNADDEGTITVIVPKNYYYRAVADVATNCSISVSQYQAEI